jgi:hypothetical protein
MNTIKHKEQERTLIKIARALPSNRVEQLVDFARFLEAQILSEELAKEESLHTTEADNAQWDTLLETDASQDLLDKLAEEALAEHKAGQTKLMMFKKGRIVPG